MANGELMFEDLQDLVGRELDGRYVLEKFLDRGGYGAVYVGTDKKFNQTVAIKVGLSSREFMKEARLAAEVKHHHIVQVTDFGSDKGIAYLVMEYLHGDDLEKVFKKQGYRLSPEQLRKLVNEIGDALAYAHADHLIHRDLKPRNIILREHVTKSGSATGNVKFVLLDFGIAAKLDADGTQRNRTQDGAGTVEYMAPELLTRDPRATPQSDIYAFGVILYQMMTGRVPFPQSDTSHMALAQCLNSICNDKPPRFSEANADRKHPAALEELVLQCLEKDPARRPQSMAEVRDRYIDLHDAAYSPLRQTKTIRKPTKPRTDFTKTIRPEDLGQESDEPDEDDDDSVHPPPQKPHRTSLWPLLLISLIALGAGGWIISEQFVGTKMYAYDTLTDDAGNQIDEKTPLTLTAGKSVTLIFAVNDVPRESVVEFEPPTTPDGLSVELSNGPIPGTSRRLVISVPDLNSKVTGAQQLVMRAKIPGSTRSFDRTINLNVEHAKPWLPSELAALEFRESPDSRRFNVGGEMYASIIDRRVAGKAVRFRLVPSANIGDRKISPFYIMERPVSNAQFYEFAKTNPGFEIETRRTEERHWESSDSADFPVTDVYALEAQKFAWWLAGSQFGTLPSATEWEVAAGYWDFIRHLKVRFGNTPLENIAEEKLREIRLIPFENHPLGAKVWIGIGPANGQYQEPNGELLKDRSPYCCEYNRLKDGTWLTEFTRTLMDFRGKTSDLRALCQNGIPDPKEPRMNKGYQVTLRGSGPSGTEITWIATQDGFMVKSVKDLSDQAAECPLLPEGFGKMPYVGFRVVISTGVHSTEIDSE